jgi:hypothetical protein
MNDVVATVLAIGILFVGLPLLILALRDRRAAARRAAAPSSADERQREQRLLAPDWPLVQQHLRRPVPSSLRELYADHALVLHRDLNWDDEKRIHAFEPLDGEAFAAAAGWCGFDVVAIATTDVGDTIYLKPGADERDVLYLMHHDGSDIEVFAVSVAAMLTRLRGRQA